MNRIVIGLHSVQYDCELWFFHGNLLTLSPNYPSNHVNSDNVTSAPSKSWSVFTSHIWRHTYSGFPCIWLVCWINQCISVLYRTRQVFFWSSSGLEQICNKKGFTIHSFHVEHVKFFHRFFFEMFGKDSHSNRLILSLYWGGKEKMLKGILSKYYQNTTKGVNNLTGGTDIDDWRGSAHGDR